MGQIAQKIKELVSNVDRSRLRFDAHLAREYNTSLEILDGISAKCGDDETKLNLALREFFQLRWQHIKNTPAAYCAYPDHPLNALCMQLAKAVAEPDEALAKILMPSLEVEHYGLDDTLKSLTENEDGNLLLNAFIVSHDGKAIIHLEDFFNNQDPNSSDINLNHQYMDLNGSYQILSEEDFAKQPNPDKQTYAQYCATFKAVPLSPEDRELLKHISPASAAYFEEYEFRHGQTSHGLGGDIRKLIEDCNRYSAYGGNGGTGLYPNSEVVTPIQTFLKKWNQIGPYEKARINRECPTLTGIILHFRFGIYDPTLTAEEKRMQGGDFICIAILANQLDRILLYYPRLFSNTSRREQPIAPLFMAAKISLRTERNYSPEGSTRLAATQETYGRCATGPITHLDDFLFCGNALNQAAFDQKTAHMENRNEIFQQAFQINTPQIPQALIKYYRSRQTVPAATTLAYAFAKHWDDLARVVLAHPNFKTDSFNTSWGEKTPITWAIEQKKPELIVLMIKKGTNVHTVLTKDNWKIIHFAVANNWLAVVDALMEQDGFLDNTILADGKTLLHLAAVYKHPDMIKKLGQYEPQSKPSNYLDFFAPFNNLQFPLQSQSKPTETDNLGNTPLHTAVHQAHIESVDALLERPDKTEFIDIQNKEKLTALQMAVRDGRIEIIDSLIRNGADYSGTFGSHNESLFDYALRAGRPNIVLALLLKGERPRHHGKQPLLHWAIQHKNAELSQYLLSNVEQLEHNQYLLPEIVSGMQAMQSIKLDYDFLMVHPKLNLMFKAYGFEKMCQLADIQPNSHKALMLYTMGELNRIKKSGNDLATGAKVMMLEHGLTQGTRKTLIHALKIQRGWFTFRDADSYRLMPSALKNQ